MEIFETVFNYVAAIFFVALVVLLFAATVRWAYTHFMKTEKWVNAMATMTGKTCQVTRGNRGSSLDYYTEYEITYYGNGKAYHKYFNLYPAPDLEEVVAGTQVSIRYEATNPANFEVLEIIEQ